MCDMLKYQLGGWDIVGVGVVFLAVIVKQPRVRRTRVYEHSILSPIISDDFHCHDQSSGL